MEWSLFKVWLGFAFTVVYKSTITLPVFIVYKVCPFFWENTLHKGSNAHFSPFALIWVDYGISYLLPAVVKCTPNFTPFVVPFQEERQETVTLQIYRNSQTMVTTTMTSFSWCWIISVIQLKIQHRKPIIFVNILWGIRWKENWIIHDVLKLTGQNAK